MKKKEERRWRSRKEETEARKGAAKGGEDREHIENDDVICVGNMEHSYEESPPHLIQTILCQYKKGVRGHGFKALATKYGVKGGHKLVSSWYSKWDGSESSLKKQSGGDRRSILTEKEKKKHVRDFIVKSSKKEAVTYPDVKKNVESKTKKALGLTTVKDYGKSFNITSKKRKRVLKSEGFASFYIS